jgi:hypothetical protein
MKVKNVLINVATSVGLGWPRCAAAYNLQLVAGAIADRPVHGAFTSDAAKSAHFG